MVDGDYRQELIEYGVESRRVHAARSRCDKLIRGEGFQQTEHKYAEEIWLDAFGQLKDRETCR